MENNKTPKIRFKGFTDAWEQSELETLGTIVTGSTPSTQETSYYSDDGIPWVTPTDIDENITFNVARHLSNKGQSVARVVPENTILVTCIASIGKNTMLGTKGSFNQQINGLTPNEKFYNPYFLLTLSNKWSYKMKVSASAGTMQIVNKTEFSAIKTFVTNKPEQTKIGTFFKTLDNLITCHKRKCDKLVNVKKSMLEKMFPKNGEKIPEVRFKGFTEAWEQRKLGEVIDVNSGCDYKHLNIGDIPVYGTGGYMLSVDKALSYKSDAIGIGRKGTIDNPYLLKSPFWTVDTLFYAIPKANYELNFMFDIFQKINWKQKDESTGVPSLSKVAINNIEIHTTDLLEQTQIGNFFKTLDNLITCHKRELEKLKNIKKSLLEKMFV